MEIVITYVSGLFKGHWLPSHDISHHLRVWKHASELATAINRRNAFAGNCFFEELLIACFFHDTGLLADPGENHGVFSRRYCEDFLSRYNDLVSFDKHDLLEAVEFHDRKDYGSNSDPERESLYKILTVADDLDALGATGLYRYVEIYLVRGIHADRIPGQILKNVQQRFDHLTGTMEKYYIDHEKYRKKYNTIVHLLDEQNYSESPGSLVSWISNEVVLPRKDPFRYLVKYPVNRVDNERIFCFLKEFRQEAEERLC